MTEIQEIEQFFGGINIQEIRERIEDFNLNTGYLDSDKLIDSLKNVLLYEIPNTGGFKKIILSAFSREYQVGAQFFRARKLNKEMDIYSLKVEDFWEPPSESIVQGRFNRPAEPYLYLTAGEYLTPKKELEINIGERYLLIYYQLNEVLSLYEFSRDDSISIEISNESKEKIQLINNFINELMLDDKVGAHLISSVLSNEILNYSEFDGWCYPSVKNSSATNACVKVSTKYKLNLQSVFLCEVCENLEDKFIGMFSMNDNIVSYQSYDCNPSKIKEEVDKMYSDNREISKKTFDEQQNRPPKVVVNLLNDK